MREELREPAADAARGERSVARTESSLVRLREAGRYKVADGDPDIRGWEVKTTDGRKVGIVDDLIIDTRAMRARHVEVKADRNLLGIGADDRYFLVPIGAACLDANANEVVVRRIPAGGFTAAWSYERGRFTSEREASLLTAYGYDAAKPESPSTGEAAGDDLYDDRRFWGRRRNGREGKPYITRVLDGDECG
jgi:hypothetical protein